MPQHNTLIICWRVRQKPRTASPLWSSNSFFFFCEFVRLQPDMFSKFEYVGCAPRSLPQRRTKQRATSSGNCDSTANHMRKKISAVIDRPSLRLFLLSSPPTFTEPPNQILGITSCNHNTTQTPHNHRSMSLSD